MKTYVLYKGDDAIAIGTAKEIADKLNIKPATVRWYARPCAKRGNMRAVAV